MAEICRVFLPLIVCAACLATGRRILAPDGPAFGPNLGSAAGRSAPTLISTSKSAARHTPVTADVATFPELTFKEFQQVKRGGLESLPQYRLSTSEDSSEYVELDNMIGGDYEIKFERDIGELVEGMVESFNTQVGQGRGALIAIGGKQSAFLPVTEMSLEAVKKSKPTDYVEVGQNLKVVVTAGPDELGGYTVSRRSLLIDESWEKIAKFVQEDAVINVTVIKNGLAGAIVSLFGVEGFIPKMHLNAELTDDLIGTTLPCKFLEADRGEDGERIVLSNKNALMQETMKNIKVGDVITGEVQGITNFGCFVDFGGVSGLLHISQVSGMRVVDMNDVVQTGSILKAMIIDMATARGNRVSLSTKVLEPVPGDMLADPQMVFEKAEETAAEYHRLQKEKREKMEAALERALGNFESPPPTDKGKTQDSLLDAIFGDSPKKEAKDPLADVLAARKN